MSFSVISIFQRTLQSEFENHDTLNKFVEKISQSLIKSNQYPYIYHHIKEGKKLEGCDNTYNISGEINIIFRDNSLNSLGDITICLEDIFYNILTKVHEFNYISGNLTNLKLDRSKDSLTTIAKIEFLTLIKMEP